MLTNLATGTIVIAATVLIHTLGLMAITSSLNRVNALLRVRGHRSRLLTMVAIVLGLFAVFTVEIWLWAGCHYMLGVVGDFETALYFSTATFSTVGYGDVIPPARWRMFAALEGIDGFLLIGWSTAYLVASGVRLGPFRSGEHF